MKTLLKKYLRFLYANVVRGYTQAMFAFFEKNPNAVLLDAGCWDGNNTVKYAEAIGTNHVLGLDVVHSALEKAKARKVDARFADFNKQIPLPDASVDVIVANHVIEHLYSVTTFAGELYRVLKPGGYVVLGTPNLASWHNVFALFCGTQPFSAPILGSAGGVVGQLKKEKNERLLTDIAAKNNGEEALGHIVVLTYKTLVRLLQNSGFVIESSRCFGYHPLPGPVAHLMARLDKHHSHYVLLKARKPV